VNKAYLQLILAVAMASTVSPACAQQQDTGASGVIDGSDVYQFLNSGAIIDGTRMEEASRKFDSAIKMPVRTRQCKNWQEVMDRDRQLDAAGVGAVYPNDGTQNAYTTQPGYSPGAATGAAASGAPAARGTTATGMGWGGTPSNPYPYGQPQKQPHGFMHKLGDGFVRASEWVGFPISDEPLPGDVDASLAGDLPAGPDPRVYVHETKYQPGQAPSAVQRPAEQAQVHLQQPAPQQRSESTLQRAQEQLRQAQLQLEQAQQNLKQAQQQTTPSNSTQPPVVLMDNGKQTR
jgi:hypothetical protein